MRLINLIADGFETFATGMGFVAYFVFALVWDFSFQTDWMSELADEYLDGSLHRKKRRK